MQPLRVKRPLTISCFAVAAWTVSCAAGDPTDTVGQREFSLEGEDETCLVPDEVVEHTCQHANFGPFVSASAQAYPGFVFTDLSAPHTAFNLTLPGTSGSFEGAVLFSPSSDGEYALFSTPGVPVAVFDGEGTPVVIEREGATDAELCAEIERVAVFHADSAQTYTLVYGPAEEALTQTLFEFLGEGGCEACEHVHLHASRSLRPPSNEVGEAQLDHPIAFEVPSEITVTEGSACVGTTLFSFRAENGPLVQCLYVAHPATNSFQLFGCSGGFDAGDDMEADYFKLRVNPLSALKGFISVELEIEDESCGEHEHDE